jgi:RNA polymerase-binding transcription factor DksA
MAKDTPKFKKRLEKEKREIEAELKKHKNLPNFGDDVDPDQETDESAEINRQLSLIQVFKNRLADIESALRKIWRKTYGTCEKCGGEISADVLKINPESRLCKKCKRHHGL